MVPKTILIIDFDQKSLGSLKETLSPEGYRVLTATDGQVGWDKFIDETPDLVIIEPMLSKLHGFELCQKITSHPEYKVPVFIMTGVYKDFIYKSEALRTYGASEYFEKPLDMPSFLEAVRRAVPLPKCEPKKAASPGPVPVTRPSPPNKDREFEVPTIEELKSMVSEMNPKTGPEKKPAPPAHGQSGRDEIDAMLKSALSDFGLGEEKKRPPEKPKTITPPSVPPPPNRPAKRLEPVPRTPPPPAPAETPVEPTPPKPEKGIVFGPPPGFGAAAKTVDDTNGDPGRRPALFETRKAEPKPVPVTPPKPVPSARTESPVPKPRPAREHENKPSFVPQPARLQHDRDTISPAILEDLDKPEKKKGLPLLAIVGPSVVVLGVAGFLFLRPKTKSSESPVQAGVKPISAPVKSGSNPTQSPAEFTAEVERKAAALTKELREKAKANVAEPPPNPIVGDPVLDVPVKPTTESLELAGAPVRRNGEERAAGNPAAKPAPKTAENPPAKTESGGVSAAGTSTAESAPPPPAAKTVNEGDLWPLEEVDVPPQVLRRINPVYPSLAQMLKIEGSITVNALVSETGSVIDTAILKGMKDDRGLEKAAAEAVRKWRFEPALKNGIRVKVWRPVVIVFELEK